MLSFTGNKYYHTDYIIKETVSIKLCPFWKSGVAQETLHLSDSVGEQGALTSDAQSFLRHAARKKNRCCWSSWDQNLLFIFLSFILRNRGKKKSNERLGHGTRSWPLINIRISAITALLHIWSRSLHPCLYSLPSAFICISPARVCGKRRPLLQENWFKTISFKLTQSNRPQPAVPLMPTSVSHLCWTLWGGGSVGERGSRADGCRACRTGTVRRRPPASSSGC